MLLSNLCQDLRNACERAYEHVYDAVGAGSINGRRRPADYEKLTKDEGGNHGVRLPETMDREVAEELVELAVSGGPSRKMEKSTRPGGETFSAPSNISSSKSVASESLKELSASVQSLGKPSADEQIQMCRELENKIFTKIRLFRDVDSALDSGEVIFLVDGQWFEEWMRFLKGAKRPGQIINAKVNQQNGTWGKSFIGLDAKGWGILSDLYKFDLAVEFEGWD